jgi:hypothetical protein
MSFNAEMGQIKSIFRQVRNEAPLPVFVRIFADIGLGPIIASDHCINSSLLKY